MVSIRIVLAVLLLFGFFCAAAFGRGEARNYLASDYERGLKKYHGVEVMYQGYDNKYYFYRKGKKVRL